MSENIRVMVVDDNQLLRFGLLGAIDMEPGLEAAGDASSSEEAVELYQKMKPDIVTMDYRMPGEDGVACTEKIMAIDPDAKVILFSVFESEEEVWKAVQAGVKGYLTKSASAVEDVMEAIHEVAEGYSFFPASIARKISARKQQEELTPRELELLQMLGQGTSNKELVEYFNISMSTVKHHITNIREKLGAADRTQAVVIAYKKGILKLDEE
ncbi:response regulator transcription factor [Pontiella agarivorans]|uniref:Response regulator transcription factor n=1 Tax=Pontiella agarivorans TaxID=3038953 RepID=A0ABU5MU99_9BACT|nr:response regulator transcription factor [Pontiella agarivorans]MDZ8117794.1 response regulator transcription factor [Pontiella agarivorans]